MTTRTAGPGNIEAVCTLPTDALKDRLTMVRRDILPHARRREPLTNGTAVEFDFTPEFQRTLEDLVVAERACCDGLTWNLTQPTDAVLRLEITGLAADSDFFRAIGELPPSADNGRFARLAQALGLGAGVALLLCCLAPLAIAAVGGVAVSAALAQLDDPRLIAGVALAIAVPSWFWLRRRAERAAESACAGGC